MSDLPEWVRALTPPTALAVVCVLLALKLYRERHKETGDASPTLLHLEDRVSSVEKRMDKIEPTVAELAKALQDHMRVAGDLVARLIRVETKQEGIQADQTAIREDQGIIKTQLIEADRKLTMLVQTLLKTG